VFQHNTAVDEASNATTLHDFSNVTWHNGAARTVTAAIAVPAGVSFPVTDCRGVLGWVNRTITSSGGIAPRTFVTSIAGGCAPNGVVNLNQPLIGAGLGAGQTLKIENSNPRSFTDASFTGGGNIVTSNLANFTNADVGLSISGTQVPLGATIASVAANTATLTVPFVFDGFGPFNNQTISIGDTYQATDTRTIDDATYTALNQITSSAARFKPDDIGLQVYGTGIANPCYITARTPTIATLNSGCTAADAPVVHTVTIGDPSATAPLNGETVMDYGTQLDLTPTLVPGTRPCTDDSVEGFHTAGTWVNPGSFTTGPFANQPPNTKAIGEILVNTRLPGLFYAGFVIEVPALTAGDPISAAHYNLTFPNTPIMVAECPPTATSPGLGYSMGVVATTPSESSLQLATGRPGTDQLRSTQDNAQTGSTTTAYLTSEDPAHPLVDTGQYHRICIIPAGPPTVGFACGTG
jgi:hypothetical protein